MKQLTYVLLIVAFPFFAGNSFGVPDRKPIGENHIPKTHVNSIGMKFVWISPGCFTMGSPLGEKERENVEVQHKVTLTKGFYMGVYLVTQEQWQEIMGNNPSEFKGEKKPVDSVSWNDCQSFIKALRERDQWPYRLPTEAEWEYACRAGTTTPFYFGETISTDEANYNGDIINGIGKKGVFRKGTTAVGSFPANPWGLHDMHGNLLQWCQDWSSDYPPNDVVDPLGTDEKRGRVVHGGSWLHGPKYCRSAFRGWNTPATRYHAFGFRVCFNAGG